MFIEGRATSASERCKRGMFSCRPDGAFWTTGDGVTINIARLAALGCP